MQLDLLFFAECIQGEGPEQGGAALQRVSARFQLVVVITLPVLQIVEDLEGDSQVASEQFRRYSSGEVGQGLGRSGDRGLRACATKK